MDAPAPPGRRKKILGVIYRRAEWHATRIGDRNSVRPSACSSVTSVNCDKMKETSVQTLIPYERSILIFFTICFYSPGLCVRTGSECASRQLSDRPLVSARRTILSVQHSQHWSVSLTVTTSQVSVLCWIHR